MVSLQPLQIGTTNVVKYTKNPGLTKTLHDHLLGEGQQALTEANHQLLLI